MAEFDLIKGDVNKEVANLREKPGKDIVVLGSGVLLRGLMKDGPVDAYILLIHPPAIGTGQRLFDDGVPDADFKLQDSKTTSTGASLRRMRPSAA